MGIMHFYVAIHIRQRQTSKETSDPIVIAQSEQILTLQFCLIISDIRGMNSQAVYARNTGMIILGGGLVKHHICNANLMVMYQQAK